MKWFVTSLLFSMLLVTGCSLRGTSEDSRVFKMHRNTTYNAFIANGGLKNNPSMPSSQKKLQEEIKKDINDGRVDSAVLGRFTSNAQK